ncbi:hypothetical protein [Streptomyces sp. NPDC005865]|uniref:hypothetical protein n=1 Tax=Streptomyces sp. NPDC005865 TaxID=3155453 RepID=UPI0033C64615
MNPTPDQAPAAPHPPSADLVQVVLGECSVADADTVFTVLRAHFPSDRGTDAPRQTEDPGPAVWTGGFLADRSPDHVPGTLLAGPVTADLHGGPVAVARLREALEAAFVVATVGTASGDQEVDVQLRLTGPEHGAPIGES